MDKVANRDPLQDTNDLHEHMPWSDNLPKYIKDFK